MLCVAVLALAQQAAYSSEWLNAQLYPCNTSEPWGVRQSFVLSERGALTLKGQQRELQLGNGGAPSASTTCPPAPASCFNVVLDVSPAPAALALTFAFNASSAQIVARLPCNASGSASGSASASASASALGPASAPAAASALCLAADWSHSHGFLPNVLVTECAGVVEQRWDVRGSDSTVRCTVAGADAPATQCLDAGSGGSAHEHRNMVDAAEL